MPKNYVVDLQIEKIKARLEHLASCSLVETSEYALYTYHFIGMKYRLLRAARQHNKMLAHQNWLNRYEKIHTFRHQMDHHL